MVIPPTAVASQSRACAATSSAERGEAGRQQDRPLGVDQILGGGAAGEHHLADHERVGRSSASSRSRADTLSSSRADGYS